MKTKKFYFLIGFTFFLLYISVLPSSNCTRHRYLDLPSIEITNEEKNAPPPLKNSSEKEEISSIPTGAPLPDIKIETGKASFYADKFQGKPTANGELYDRAKLTAAHRTLPLGTFCRVTNTTNKKSVTVRINDRGPHVARRIIDLSYEAMRLLDGLKAGEIDVMVKVLK